LVALVLVNGLEINRLGITASKKVGGSVIRNRVRRLIREVYRLNEAQFKTGFDIVFVARHKAALSDFKEIETYALRILKKLDILRMKEH
jgi:ribonuclease P protein component